MQDATQQNPPFVILGPPEEIDAATLAFCATISPHAPFYVPVDPQPDTRVAYCFDNSVQQAQKHGGAAAYGWAIWRWPGRWFEAEHHAVWRKPDGSMLDVTPQHGNPARILFLPDPEAVFDPEKYRRNVMAPDAGNALAAEYIDLARQRTDITDRYWYPGVEILPLFSPEDRAEIAPIDARMIALRREMIASKPANPSQRFADMVRQRGHPLNPAWQDLTGEAAPGEKARAADIRYLLRLVRRRYPDLESQFEEARVLRWERRGNTALWIFAVLGIVLAVVAAFLVFSVANRVREMSKNLPPPAIIRDPSATALTNQRVDVDRALEMMFGDQLSVADIEDRNPELAQLLNKLWNDSRERGDDSSTFVAKLAGGIDIYYRNALRAAPPPLIVEYFRINLDGATALRKHSAEDCAGFANGGAYDASLLPPEIAPRGQKLATQVLLNPSPTAPEGQGLTPALRQAAATRAALTLAAFDQALQGQGSAENQCAATIALWETLLALPPEQGAALLRKL